MPLIMVWPVSLSMPQWKVGSSRFKDARTSASFALSAAVRGSIDMLTTVSGNEMLGRQIGFLGSLIVSPVRGILEAYNCNDITGGCGVEELAFACMHLEYSCDVLALAAIDVLGLCCRTLAFPDICGGNTSHRVNHRQS